MTDGTPVEDSPFSFCVGGISPVWLWKEVRCGMVAGLAYCTASVRSLLERSTKTPHGDGRYFRVFLLLFFLGRGKFGFAGRNGRKHNYGSIITET
jgi:hypothetical protein